MLTIGQPFVIIATGRYVGEGVDVPRRHAGAIGYKTKSYVKLLDTGSIISSGANKNSSEIRSNRWTHSVIWQS